MMTQSGANVKSISADFFGHAFTLIFVTVFCEKTLAKAVAFVLKCCLVGIWRWVEKLPLFRDRTLHLLHTGPAF